jgi:RNA polymerase sigma factor (sigma-70 family)
MKTPMMEDCLVNAPDELLVQAIQAGHAHLEGPAYRAYQESCSILYSRYRSKLLRFFIGCGLDRGRSEELGQETLVRAFHNIRTLVDSSAFGSWLFTAALNIYKNEVRRARPSAQGLSLETVLDAEAESRIESALVSREKDPLELALLAEKFERVQSVLDELPPQMRRCLYLRLAMGLKYREVAAKMGISVQTVKAHLHQASQRLKAAVTEDSRSPVMRKRVRRQTMPIGRKLRNSFADITAINDLLHYDSMRCLEQLGEDLQRVRGGAEVTAASRYQLKKTVRAFVGQVDGLAYVFRQAVLASADEVGLTLTTKERAALSEHKYDKSSDTILDTPDLLKTLEGLKLALKHFPRLFGSSYTLDTSRVAWRGLKRLVDVRNGLAHPSNLNDMSPANAAPILGPTIDWFFYQMQLMYADIAPRIGVTLRAVEQKADPFLGFDEKAYPWHEAFSEADHQLIASNWSQSLKYTQIFLDQCHDERHRAIEEVGRHKGRHILNPAYQSDVRNGIVMVFTTVEAMIFVAKRYVLSAESRGEITLTADDHDRLENGEVEDRLAAAMTLWSRKVGAGQVWKTAGEEWKKFRGARFRRNQFAHPKSVDRLRVTSQDLNHLSAILSYYKQALNFMHLEPR